LDAIGILGNNLTPGCGRYPSFSITDYTCRHGFHYYPKNEKSSFMVGPYWEW
jgi:hypothetical protein